MVVRGDDHGVQWPKDVDNDTCFVVSTAKAQFHFVAESKESARYDV